MIAMVDCLAASRDPCCAIILAFLMPGLGNAEATNYRIDPTETTASFEVRMLGIIPIRGNFKNTTGDMQLELASHSGSIEVRIDAATLVANSVRAQAAARGADFFNVEKYPRIEFKSSRFVYEDSQLHAIEGRLTLMGATQPVTLAVSRATCKPATDREPPVCRAEATLTVKRSAFGMKRWSHSVGDIVTIRIALVAFAEAAQAKTLLPPVTSPVGTSEALH